MDGGERLRRWQLVLPHRAYLVRIAVSRGMSRDDAEDCAQEAMVRCVAFTGLDETRVVEFLATTTMRLAVDRHRTYLRDAKVGARLTPWYVDEPSPEEATCDRGEAAWVAAHVAALPESQRAALAAKAEGLNGHEIAALMGVSYKAVESLLSRARAYVRAAVATVWVLLARANRREAEVPYAVPAMALAALVTAGVLSPGVPGGPGGTPPPATTAAGPARAAAVPGPRATAGPPVRPAAAAFPAGTRGDAPDRAAPRRPFVPPLPTPLPADPCDAKLPHVDTCLRLDDYEPGKGLRNCLENGPRVSTSGVYCPPS